MDPMTMMRFRYVRCCSLLEVWDYWRNKHKRANDTSQNGRDAWVALCTHRTHILILNVPFKVQPNNNLVLRHTSNQKQVQRMQ
jgi:hypothetical protein